MSRMAYDFFAASPVLLFPLLALVLFFAVFAAICVRTYRLSPAEVRRRSHLPLARESHESEGGRHE